VELDHATVERVAARAAGEPFMELVDWSTEPIRGGMAEAIGIGEGVLRVSGVGLAEGRATSWSVIRKQLKSAPGHDDPADWDFWKREALAYSSDLLVGLGDGLIAPACYGVDEIDDERIAIWLEDVRPVGPSTWPLARYGLAARHLGRFNGSYLTGRPMPAWPWLSPGRIRSWLALGERGANALPRLAEHPIGLAWLTGRSVDRIQRQWLGRERLLAGLDRLPRCLCHHDAFRRNLIAGQASDGGERTVAIDWAGVGRGAVGEDLGALVAISLQFLDVDAVDAAELDGIAFAGYIAGLDDVGASLDDRLVRFGYAAAASLLLGVGGACGWLDWLVEDAGHVEQAQAAIGHPIDEILAQWRELQSFLLDLGDEAGDLLATIGDLAHDPPP
jgi:hypothetical protein